MGIGAPNAGTATTGTAATSHAIPYPASVTAGTILVLNWSQFSAGTTVTTPAGWTLREYQTGSNTGATAGNVAVFWKVAAGTEGGTSLTVTHQSSTVEAQIVEWSGVDTTTPFDVADITAFDTLAATTLVIGAITPVTANVTLVYAAGSNTAAQTAGTLPSGFTQLTNGSGASCNLLSGYEQNQPASSSGTVTVTWSGSGKHVGILYALRPAGGASTINGTASLAADSTLSTAVTQGVTASPAADSTLTTAVTLGVTTSLAAASVLTTAVTLVSKATLTAASTLSNAVTQLTTMTASAASSITNAVVQRCTASLSAGASLSASVVQRVTAAISAVVSLVAQPGGSVTTTPGVMEAGTAQAGQMERLEAPESKMWGTS